MEGNDCYKYGTIKRFIEAGNLPPVRVLVDIGANVGETLILANSYFPQASIIGFEPVLAYFNRASERTKHFSNIKVYNSACTSQHLYADDFGECAKSAKDRLRVYEALPSSGPGWLGGSIVDGEEESTSLLRPGWQTCYRHREESLNVMSLEEVMQQENLGQIDVLKLDCEGCEFSLLGAASFEVLQKVRFICGEYHDIARLYQVMVKKLYKTHKVALVGDKYQGSFFAERLDGEKDGVLKFDRSHMLFVRSWLSSEPIDWNVFNEAYVPADERAVHGF